LDLLDLEDLQACKDPLDPKASKAPWENLETLDPQAHLVLVVQEACLVYPEKMENLDVMERAVPWDLQDLQAKEAYQECLVCLGQRDTEVSLAWMEQKEALEALEKKEKMAHLAHLDPVVQWVQLAQEEKEAVRVHLDLLDFEVSME